MPPIGVSSAPRVRNRAVAACAGARLAARLRRWPGSASLEPCQLAVLCSHSICSGFVRHRLSRAVSGADPLAHQARQRVVRVHARVYEGDITALGIGGSPLRFGVVVGRFNSLVTDRLLGGALSALTKSGVADADVHVAYVPGSFEIPLVAKSMARSGSFDAIICIGAVVRGATTHYEEVCGAATSGCSHAAVSTGVYAPRGLSRVRRSGAAQMRPAIHTCG
jgi:6,7-dimethyl-8-ribityllumazine synthase